MTRQAQAESKEVDVDAIADAASNLIHCPVKGCPRAFETKRGLSNHLPIHEQNKSLPNGSHVPGYIPPKTVVLSNGTFMCPQCGFEADNDKSMASHKRHHFAEAREEYIRGLEIAAREVGTLRKALREANKTQDVSDETVESESGFETLTVDTAIEFIRDQFYDADLELAALTAELKELRNSAPNVAPSGDAIATMELIRDAFMKFYVGDQTMTRFVTEVEDAVRLMYPDITEE